MTVLIYHTEGMEIMGTIVVAAAAAQIMDCNTFCCNGSLGHQHDFHWAVRMTDSTQPSAAAQIKDINMV